MNQDRRSFLTALTAALGVLGIKTAVPSEEASLVGASTRISLRRGKTLEVAHEIPTSVEGFSQLGVSDSDVLALATSAYLLRQGVSARAAFRDASQFSELDEADLEEVARTAFLHYRPLRQRRRRG